MVSLVSNVYVDSTAFIDEEVNVGNGTKIWHFVHIMKDAKIGKNCIIADYVYVGRDVIIGDNVKIENRATIFNGVTIQDDAFIGPHVVFTNDLYPRSTTPDWKILPTSVKKGASLGAGSVIVCGVTIGEYALIGAGSVVTRNVPPYSLAYGNPARVRGFICRCGKKFEVVKKTEKNVFMKCNCCKASLQMSTNEFIID
jgi:acetyltransferase-like isoleucine patch superfamily enzyme